MGILTTWITVVAVASIMIVTAQTLWDYHQKHRNPYDSYDLAAAIRRHPVTHNTDELRIPGLTEDIPGLTEDEADKVRHAINDDLAAINDMLLAGNAYFFRSGNIIKRLPPDLVDIVDASETGDRVVYGGDTYEITKWD